MAITHISELLRQGRPLKSLEFFPPKTEKDKARLLLASRRLREFCPDFVSVTYGAGGSTRQFTQEITRQLQSEFGWLMMPHLTCVGSTRDELFSIVRAFHQAGFRNIMALRGDPPRGADKFVAVKDGFRYASDLVAFIKEHFPEFCLGVAGYPEKHPEAPSFNDDLAHLKFKVDRGGDFITTQLFYDNKAYFDFVERLRGMGVDQPVLPGILPILSIAQVKRFGITLPQKLFRQLKTAGKDKARQRQIGIDWATDQIADLLDGGAPGVHLFVLNQSKSALGILHNLQDRGYFPDDYER